MFKLRKLEDRIVLDGAGMVEVLDELYAQDAHDDGMFDLADGADQDMADHGVDTDEPLFAVDADSASAADEGLHVLVVDNDIANSLTPWRPPPKTMSWWFNTMPPKPISTAWPASSMRPSGDGPPTPSPLPLIMGRAPSSSWPRAIPSPPTPWMPPRISRPSGGPWPVSSPPAGESISSAVT